MSHVDTIEYFRSIVFTHSIYYFKALDLVCRPIHPDAKMFMICHQFENTDASRYSGEISHISFTNVRKHMQHMRDHYAEMEMTVRGHEKFQHLYPWMKDGLRIPLNRDYNLVFKNIYTNDDIKVYMAV